MNGKQVKSMTLERMREAGKKLNSYEWTNEELSNCIEGAKLALAFLEGTGIKWQLAISPLRSSVYDMEGMHESRKIGKCSREDEMLGDMEACKSPKPPKEGNEQS